MSLSRLVGLVSVLVLGTLLSVWWYLQVPEAHLQVLAPDPELVEMSPSEAPPVALPPSVNAVPAAARRVVPVPSLPTSVAPTRSMRWTRRVSTDPQMNTANTARAREAVLQNAVPGESRRRGPVSGGQAGPAGAKTSQGASATCADPCSSRPRS